MTCASFKTSVAVIKSPNSRVYAIITRGIASKYMSKDGNPIAKGDVLLNKETTSGILKPHSIEKVTSFRRNATIPAITNPGSNPNDPNFLKKLLLSASFLNGSEKVVITHKEIATIIDIGCIINLSISVIKT